MTVVDANAVRNLKLQALECKKAGDLAGAKRFLLEAKQLEAQFQKQESVRLPQNQQKEALQQATAATQLNATADPVNDICDEATLDELTGSGRGNVSKPVKFTEEELLDTETMLDMQSCGMDIAPEYTYQQKIDSYKRAAVQAKQKDDIPSARANLMKCKQFQQAFDAIYNNAGGADGDDDLLEDDADYGLLEELMGNADNDENDDAFARLYQDSNNNFDLEDLDDLDSEMLQAMMETGMQVPDYKDVLQDAAAKKQAAIGFKKAGNIPAASAALQESKRLQQRGEQLRMLLSDKGDGNAELSLDALMAESDKPAAAAPKKKQAAEKAVPASEQQNEESEHLKSAQEYKMEAVQCKRDGNLQEAGIALRNYKRAMAIENAGKLAAARENAIAALKKEHEFAQEQCRLFAFYKIVNAKAAPHYDYWKGYCDRLVEYARNPPKQLDRTHKATSIANDNLAFVGNQCKTSGLELHILNVLHLSDNKELKSRVAKNAIVKQPARIKVAVTVQLPPNDKQPDDTMEAFCWEGDEGDDGSYNLEFQPTEQCAQPVAPIPRDTSRYAKQMMRRMTRKNILIEVSEVVITKTKPSFFAKMKETREESVLGTAVIDLQHFLTNNNSIAGEFDLLNHNRRHSVGGSVQLAVRTASPFQAESVPAETGVDDNTATAATTPVALARHMAFDVLQVSATTE